MYIVSRHLLPENTPRRAQGRHHTPCAAEYLADLLAAFRKDQLFFYHRPRRAATMPDDDSNSLSINYFDHLKPSFGCMSLQRWVGDEHASNAAPGTIAPAPYKFRYRDPDPTAVRRNRSFESECHRFPGSPSDRPLHSLHRSCR